MNKNFIFNIVLALAVLILFILQFRSKSNSSEAATETAAADTSATPNLEKETVITFSDSIKPSSVTQATSSKVGYFNLEDLVEACPYLNRKTQGLVNKEKQFYSSYQNKEKEFMQWYEGKQSELAEYDKKKMLVQSHLDQAQKEAADKQQRLQMELQNEEKSIMGEKEKFLEERDEIIFAAVNHLNKAAGWDYVLVDNSEIRLVVPLNEKNNITKDIAKIINNKYK